MSIPAVFSAHRVPPRVQRPVARFPSRLAPRALRTRAPPTDGVPKESREEEITNDEETSDLWYRTRFTRSSPHRPAGVENEKQQTTFTIRTSRSNAT
jgi:hypothetical protein